MLSFVFFFFQAEDGIRDADVTGVQTCALPISRPCCKPPAKARLFHEGLTTWSRRVSRLLARELLLAGQRSEERRVGKECRSRLWTYYSRKNVMSSCVLKCHLMSHF